MMINIEFPTNVSADELAGLFVSNNKELDLDDFYMSINDEEKKGEYFELLEKYYIKNYCGKGVYATMVNSYDVLESVRLKTTVSHILGEFNIDLTHMTGMEQNDLQLIIIPFDDLISAKMFRNAISRYKTINYWQDGEVCNVT